MRVLLINSVCGSGSTGRIVADLWSILKKQGHEVKVAYGIGTASMVDEQDLIRVNDKFGYYLHNALSRITDRTGFYSQFRTRRLISTIRAFSPDLIHLHNLHGYYINLRILFEYLAEANIPVVWTLHDCWAFTGHCAHYSYYGCDRWKTGCHNCPQKNTYPKSYFLDQSKRNYNQKKDLFTAIKNMTIVTPSEWLAEQVRQSFLGRYPVQAIPNGIDLDVFKPTPSDFREKHAIGKRRMVLAVSNVWSKKKGFDDICALAKRLDPDKYKVVMVGLTEEQLSIVPKDIIAIKRTNSIRELAEIYSAADVFVNASYEDTFPTVNLEALACGTPIITYQTGGSIEAIDKNCGIAIDQGNIEKLLAALEMTCEFRAEDVMARAQMYNKNERYGDYIQVYTGILN